MTTGWCRGLGAWFCIALSACVQTSAPWTLALSHDGEGTVIEGSEDTLVSAIRQGCQIRVAWGARRRAAPGRTIEHIAEPLWVSVRDDGGVEVQLGDFLNNLGVLGEPSEDHPRRDAYGGTDRVVMWRANVKTDGTFDAVWYHPHSGEFIKRAPQRHAMKWFVDCQPAQSKPLYPEPN